VVEEIGVVEVALVHAMTSKRESAIVMNADFRTKSWQRMTRTARHPVEEEGVRAMTSKRDSVSVKTVASHMTSIVKSALVNVIVKSALEARSPVVTTPLASATAVRGAATRTMRPPHEAEVVCALIFRRGSVSERTVASLTKKMPRRRSRDSAPPNVVMILQEASATAATAVGSHMRQEPIHRDRVVVGVVVLVVEALVVEDEDAVVAIVVIVVIVVAVAVAVAVAAQGRASTFSAASAHARIVSLRTEHFDARLS